MPSRTAGVETFEVTAIERDGTMAGPDLALLGRVVEIGRGAIIASAGIATTNDLRAVRALGCAGAIVGRALYEGRVHAARRRCDPSRRLSWTARAAGQWPAASSSFLCASITFSARWAGTSS